MYCCRLCSNLFQIYTSVTAPQFTITPTNVAVSENIGEVELMVSSVSALTQETVVTVMTQLKDGAPNQATGQCGYSISR